MIHIKNTTNNFIKTNTDFKSENRVFAPRFQRVMCSEVSGFKAEIRVLKHLGEFLKHLYPEDRVTERYNKSVENHINFCDHMLHLIREGYSVIIPTDVYWGVYFE